MTVAFDPILADGEWLAHRYDATTDSFWMRHVPRSAHNTATFITDEYLGMEPDPLVLPRSQAINALVKDRSLHFILHSAFCASTMLARGFDLPGVSMGLKEPVLLNDITGYRRRGAAPVEVAERLDHALHMLARPFGRDRAIVVKPSNVFNALASVTLAMRQASKAILLYAPLPLFLASVARKGLWCRLWCRELLEGLLIDGIVDLGFEPKDYFRQTDLQVAAVGWLAQHQLFAQLASKYGPQRVATVDSETLTGRPAETLSAAARHFGLYLPENAVAEHSALATHSKLGGSFGANERQAELRHALEAHGDEIDKVVVWAETVAKGAGVLLDLPHKLAV